MTEIRCENGLVGDVFFATKWWKLQVDFSEWKMRLKLDELRLYETVFESNANLNEQLQSGPFLLNSEGQALPKYCIILWPLAEDDPGSIRRQLIVSVSSYLPLCSSARWTRPADLIIVLHSTDSKSMVHHHIIAAAAAISDDRSPRRSTRRTSQASRGSLSK